MSRKRTARAHEGSASDPAIQAAIGTRLRAYYDEVAQQPIPDRFVELLKQLDTDKTRKS